MAESIKESILAKFQLVNKEKEITSANNRSTFRKDNGKFNGQKRKWTDKRPQKRGPICGLIEADVGISEYVSPSEGISGIIKHRFSDFQVHEITKDGEVVVLDSAEIPQSTVEEEPDNDYRSVLSDEQWAELEKIIESQDGNKMSIETTNLDKAEKTKIHKAVKRAYGAKVCSNSEKEGDQTFIRIGRSTKNNDRERQSWPADQGRYLHFTLFKENMDTAFLVNILSKSLRMKPNLITFAGTKDKRAKTSQRMCVKNKRAESVKSCKCFKARFGNYSYHHSPLRLGDLSGNKFTLAIRNVTKSDEEINEALTNVQSLGFINYFGLQRFGSSATMPTHTIGKLMLLEDWKEAVSAILTPKEGVASEVQDACEIYANTKNPVLALRGLGRRVSSSIEGKVLTALKKQPNNYYDALFAIPRNSLLLYLHAYQSYVWNKVVSKRIREYGLKTVAGDLVLVDEPADIEEDSSKPVSDVKANCDKEDEGSDNDSDSQDREVPAPDKGFRIEKARALSDDEAKSTPLTDVVYPLPGNDIEFPSNDIEKWYFEFMEEDGITMGNFTNSKKVFSLYGKYRKALTTARDFKWDIVKYHNTEADLILSDMDKMKGVVLQDALTGEEAKYKAVIMDFSLDSSVYATMLLREIMKCDTSAAYHAKLTRETHVNEKEDEDPPEKQQKIEEEDVSI